MPTIQDLRTFQWVKEVTRGTDLAATSKIAIEDMEFEPLDSVYRPDLAKGLLTKNPGNETVIQRGTIWRVPESPFVYDQGQHWCAMGIVGSVSPSGVGPYTYLFPRSLIADPAPNTFTLERRLSDGAAFKDTAYHYAFATELGWHYQIDQALKFHAAGVARRVQTEAQTPSLAMPTIEIPPVPLAQVWLDSTWANLGTTQVAAQILKADVVFKTGLKPKFTFDGRADLDFTTYVIDGDEVDLDVSLTMLVGGQYDTEKTAAEAQTLRALRLKVLGTSSRELTLDCLLKHEKGSLLSIGKEDGQDIVEMKLVGATDGTNLFSAKILNQAATYA